MIILDTNVLSELLRQKPAPGLEGWVAAQPVASLFTTTITQAEMLFGVALLPRGRRRTGLAEAVAALFDVEFAGRLLFFDSSAARAFALVAAERRLAGRPIAQLDAQIAAIARSRGATLATRNTPDFQDCGISLVNPWQG
jgi:predicted nucleic acid-binding protein